jgi:hypothetical protein
MRVSGITSAHRSSKRIAAASATNSLRGSAEEAYTALIRRSKSEIPV